MTKRKAVKKTPTKRGVSFSQKELEQLFLKQLENESKRKPRSISVSNKGTKQAAKRKSTRTVQPLQKVTRTKAVETERRSVNGETESAVKVVKAKPITYSKAAISDIRKRLRKKDGTYFSERYYKNILKQIQNRPADEADDVLIELRNANPNVRYYKDSSVGILHYQVGNFVDRLSGKANTEAVTKGKRKGKKIVTGEVKRGTSISITDLYGDETETTSIVKANDTIANQNRYINKVLEILSPKEDRGKTKKGKAKGAGIYVIITETTTSNSEGEVTRISYNYYTYEVQGIEKALFADVLDEILHG